MKRLEVELSFRDKTYKTLDTDSQTPLHPFKISSLLYLRSDIPYPTSLNFVCMCGRSSVTWIYKDHAKLVYNLINENLKSAADFTKEDKNIRGLLLTLVLCLQEIPFEIISKLVDYHSWTCAYIRYWNEIQGNHDVWKTGQAYGCDFTDGYSIPPEYYLQPSDHNLKAIKEENLAGNPSEDTQTNSLDVGSIETPGVCEIQKAINETKNEIHWENWDNNDSTNEAYLVMSKSKNIEDADEIIDIIPCCNTIKNLIIQKLESKSKDVYFMYSDSV